MSDQAITLYIKICYSIFGLCMGIVVACMVAMGASPDPTIALIAGAVAGTSVAAFIIYLALIEAIEGYLYIYPEGLRVVALMLMPLMVLGGIVAAFASGVFLLRHVIVSG